MEVEWSSIYRPSKVFRKIATIKHFQEDTVQDLVSLMLKIDHCSGLQVQKVYFFQGHAAV